MNKVIPITTLIGSIISIIMSATGMVFAFLSGFYQPLLVAAIPVLFICCVTCTMVFIPALIFKHKLCKVAIVISIFSALLIVVGFIVAYSV